MQTKALTALLIGAGLLFSVPAAACEGTDCVLASRNGVNLYPIDLEASIGDLDPGVRAGILSKPERIDRLMDNVLITRQLAEMAKKAGFDQNPIVQRQMLLAAERALSEHARAAELKKRAGARDFEIYAREQYAIRMDEFSVPPTTEVAHILIATGTLCQADALVRANDVLIKARGGENFESLVQQYSDDDSKVNNAGRIEVSEKAGLDPAFKRASLALTEPGQLSEPVLSGFGYHVIKMIEKRPGMTPSYENVKEALMQNVQANYQRRIKDTLFSDLRADNPTTDHEAMASFMARFRAPTP